MQNQSVIRKHASLVDRMSDKLGVDLEEEVLRGAFPADQIADLVLRCTGCTNPDGCAQLLETEGQLEAAPAYCVNREALDKLR